MGGMGNMMGMGDMSGMGMDDIRAWKTLTWLSMVLLIPLSIFKKVLEQIDGTIF